MVTLAEASLLSCSAAPVHLPYRSVLAVFVANGIESLFPVQSMSFDAIYDGCDVIVQASK